MPIRKNLFLQSGWRSRALTKGPGKPGSMFCPGIPEAAAGFLHGGHVGILIFSKTQKGEKYNSMVKKYVKIVKNGKKNMILLDRIINFIAKNAILLNQKDKKWCRY